MDYIPTPFSKIPAYMTWRVSVFCSLLWYLIFSRVEPEGIIQHTIVFVLGLGGLQLLDCHTLIARRVMLGSQRLLREETKPGGNEDARIEQAMVSVPRGSNVVLCWL